MFMSGKSSSDAVPASWRAHEIRAWAASLAFASSVPLVDTLDAAYWRSKNRFIEFYLRDVARSNEDGTQGIASVVAAQAALRLASVPSSSLVSG